jgi:hypothetical protein
MVRTRVEFGLCPRLKLGPAGTVIFGQAPVAVSAVAGPGTPNCYNTSWC